jgi:ribosome recycling factor
MRRDANTGAEAPDQDKHLSEDDDAVRRSKFKLTDKYVAEVDKVLPPERS